MRRRHHLAGVCTFLLVVALIAGMVGCTPKEQDLTVSSTAGGSIITPGTGTFTYQKGTKVDLEATPYACYEFVNWIGDVATIADVYDSTTTINMIYCQAVVPPLATTFTFPPICVDDVHPQLSTSSLHLGTPITLVMVVARCPTV